ncbi:death-associated protein kinase [Vigna unguiculata]|uniref:Death-associated protein kinase n=1 Tax=Vigna unguiculata TaxID=3917 RepID=A0A4D6MMT3_VIGUN|nr:death-associated protein kinase [Vigna unguiculata]
MNPSNLWHSSSDEETKYHLAEYTLERKWNEVEKMYIEFPACHTAMVDDSAGTALNVAVDLDEEEVVQKLVDAIIIHNTMKALEIRNYRGDTALHVAASRGFTKICEFILGENRERTYLVSLMNKDGETPLFQAVANGRTQVFAYLSSILKHEATLQDLVRNNGDTILHCAIRNEYFDLAVIIAHYYDFLSTTMNKDGELPLIVLATKPSAFYSSTYLSLLKRIQYLRVHVELFEPGREMRAILREKTPQKLLNDNCPQNYALLTSVFTGLSRFFGLSGMERRDPEEKRFEFERISHSRDEGWISHSRDGEGRFPRNYTTIVKFVKYLFAFISAVIGGINELKETKKRHQLGPKLLELLMKRPHAAFTGRGELRMSEEEEEENETKAKMIDEKETPFLAAARNGIVEMVNEIYNLRPSVLHETNSQGENVLLVAAKNRKPVVIESLKEILKIEVWRTLCMAINKDGKTMLHMAGEVPSDDMHSQVSYSALEMVWDAKWFQYVASLVPPHYYFLRDKDQKIPWEIFKKTHDDLRKESGEWLKETSESCSVVTALVAGASFATATTVPGGIDDNGMPHFEGNPSFDAFVFVSLFGLCFSVTGLIMFLTVLTSRKQPREYRKSLPLKLVFGLSSLFLSIIALLTSFCIGHSFLFNHKYRKVILPIYVATCFPVTFFALDQVQLYVDLLAAIFSTVPNATDDRQNL